MTSEHAISFDDLEKRRQKVAEARKPSAAQPIFESDSEAMHAINEIFNPTLKIPHSAGPYRPPEEMSSDDFDAERDLDVRKLAELKETFLLFDTDCDGLISKDDLRFTFGALGSESNEELLEEMLKEAKDPLDLDAFVQLMSFRTVELDPEDVLLEAWSKWDLYGTGKIEERNCLDYIEIFPYLREPVVENTTLPEYILCNQTTSASTTTTSKNDANTTDSSSSSISTTVSSPQSMSDIGSLPNLPSIANTSTTTLIMSVHDLLPHEFIYSSGRVFGLRVRFNNRPQSPASEERMHHKIDNWNLNVTAEYRFLKKDNFKNDGRLIPGTYCDYYFFANPDVSPKSLEVWKYFHSPRFPAKYPAHIKCSYKFIGRPETRVELIFEELDITKNSESCSLDKLTIFDAESANMNAVIDVLCGNSSTGTRHILSTGPDLLIEFDGSSNVTSKGFRGKFKFIQNNEIMEMKRTNKATDLPFVADMYSGVGASSSATGGGDGGRIESGSDSIKVGAAIAGSVGNNAVGVSAQKQNLMAFHVMDNTKAYEGFTKAAQKLPPTKKPKQH